MNKPCSQFFLDIEVISQGVKIDVEYDGWYWHKDKQRDVVRDMIVKKYGYLNYPHLKILEELSAAETLCAIEVKWEDNGIFKDGKFYNRQSFSKIRKKLQ